ncbi:ribonuclease HII [Tropicimonas sp. IMCC34043]|uniref:ribonuclease HII n=1 Tax=Tropicimonas sp. IMCC34043 TaxID=2248760 RepID=UPI0035160728
MELAGWAEGARVIAGVDEVGRGPLAGPVTAAAVVLDPGNIPEGLDDSKKLSPKRREVLAGLIRQSAWVAVVHVSVEEIERLNILRAAHLAMVRALRMLDPAPDYALIDGKFVPRDLPCRARMLIRGDARCLSIAAASIVAKVARDELMVDLAQQHPGYGWDHNAGYPTPEHKAALRDLGVTPHHRRLFAPVRNILYQGKSPSD